MSKVNNIGGSNTPKKGEQGFQLSKLGKIAPTATVLVAKREEKKDLKTVAKELEEAFGKIEEQADKGDQKAIDAYDKTREKLDKALIALLPEVIDSLELGDTVNHTYIITGNPEWEGARVEAKLSDSIVTDELLAKFHLGSWTNPAEDPADPPITFTLISITKLDQRELEEENNATIDEILPGFRNQVARQKEGKGTPIRNDEYPYGVN